VRRSLLLTTSAIGALATQAHAADLGSIKDFGTPAEAINSIFDGAAPGAITVAGITVYGAVDFGVNYQSHGAPPGNGYFYPGGQYLINKNSGGGHWNFTNNAMQQSFVGLKANQSLYDLTGRDALAGWSFVSNVQIGFDPAFAKIADACKSLVLANGLGNAPDTNTPWNADGSRCGQIFNGEAYGGIKNEIWGQLTFGRHNTLLLDDLAAYDPFAGSHAFSLFAYSGTYGGGYGNTEDARWNNSLRYSNSFGNTPLGTFRIAGMHRFEGEGEGGKAYSVSAGVDLPGELTGLSIEGVWGEFKSAISASSLSAAQCADIGASGFGCTQLNVLSGTVSDNEAWSIMAKYNFEHFGLRQATLMGGYEHIDYANPSSPLPVNYSTIGNYTLGAVTNALYTTDKLLGVYWLGGKYLITPQLTLAGAWYHFHQNTFVRDGVVCNGKSGTAASPGCAGSADWVSVALDYQWTKRLDVYAGFSYTQESGGLTNGHTNTSTWNPVVGARFRF
jgi:predicted porin